MKFRVLAPAVAWVCFATCAITFAQVLRSLLDVIYPSDVKRAGLLRLRYGPGWLRDLWSTIFIFVFVVPYLLLILSMILGFALAVVEGWSLSDGFHYHLYMLSLTQVNLGDAQGPVSILGDLFNMVTTLTGSISMFIILGMAGFTTATKRFAERAPDGFIGLLRTIFLIYPTVILVLAAVIACAMCAIERWPALDSFLMACGWFSNAPIKLSSCQSSNEVTTFLILMCRMVAIAMKLTALQQIFANTFPRSVACFFDGVLGNEHDWESKSCAKSDRQELSSLQERREALEATNRRLYEERRRLKKLLREMGDPDDILDPHDNAGILPGARGKEDGLDVLTLPRLGVATATSSVRGLGLPVAGPRRKMSQPPRAVVWLTSLGLVPRFPSVLATWPQKPSTTSRVVSGIVKPVWAAPKGPASGV